MQTMEKKYGKLNEKVQKKYHTPHTIKDEKTTELKFITDFRGIQETL